MVWDFLHIFIENLHLHTQSPIFIWVISIVQLLVNTSLNQPYLFLFFSFFFPYSITLVFSVPTLYFMHSSRCLHPLCCSSATYFICFGIVSRSLFHLLLLFLTIFLGFLSWLTSSSFDECIPTLQPKFISFRRACKSGSAYSCRFFFQLSIFFLKALFGWREMEGKERKGFEGMKSPCLNSKNKGTGFGGINSLHFVNIQISP